MYLLQKSSKQDIKQIAYCQLHCFEKSFSSRLGFAYTEKSLSWFLSGDNRFLLHVTDNGKVIGYCGGFISKGRGDGSTSGMMQFAMRPAAFGMMKKPWLFFSKEIIPFYPLIFKNMYQKIFPRKTFIQKQHISKVAQEKRQGLVVIGVIPTYRGKGVFETLMNGFEEEARARKVHYLGLSVRKENRRAIQAYQKAGWQMGKELKGSYELIKEIA